MIIELWTTLKAKEVAIDRYQISNLGRVRLSDTGKVMKTFIDPRDGYGYERIGLSLVNGKRKNFSIHRLVADHFIPNVLDKPIVNHKDGIKTNNKVSNLEWSTHSENNIHALDNGLCDNKGEKSHLSKYTDSFIHSICRMLEEGKSTKEIIVSLTGKPNLKSRDREYRVLKSTIGVLRNRKSRRDITSQYNY